MEGKKKVVVSKKVDAEALHIIEEATKVANAEAIRIIKEFEKKGRQIISQAVKTAEAEANKIVTQAEEKGRQIIEEAQRTAQILANAEEMEVTNIEKAVPKGEEKTEKQKVALQQRVELVIVPPINMVQLGKLSLSLQRLANLCVLSSEVPPDGWPSIVTMMKEASGFVSDLRKIEVVEEAIEIEDGFVGPDLLHYLIENDSTLRHLKPNGERKIVVLLKGSEP
jgi:vacuolar-type H+-ATPase subunit H